MADASQTPQGSFLRADHTSLAASVGTTNLDTQRRLSAMVDSSTSSEIANTPSNPPSSPLSTPSDSESSHVSESLDGFEDQATVQQPATLHRLLFDALVEPLGYHKSQRFFPSTVFSESLNEAIIRRELQLQLVGLSPADERRLTRTICGYPSFKKIFSLLAIVDKLSDIRYFIEQEVSDDHLPLSKIGSTGCNLFTLGIPIDTDGNSMPISCFHQWNPATVRMFEEWQWSVLAPTFQCGETKDVKHLSLPDDVPLPFTADSHHDKSSNTMQGGYSTVSKVTIHPAHHRFHGLEGISGNTFAVKHLISATSREQFDREKEMLVTFSGNINPHLISLLATYEQRNEYYLIFPLASGDLQSFWRDTPGPSMTHDTVLWVAEQCLGIARGLAAIHKHHTLDPKRHQLAFADDQTTSHQVADSQACRMFGVHGDIKPQNILWFNDPSKVGHIGTLKISDFGLSEFKTSNSKIYRPTSQVAVCASYRPPECESRHGRVGQSQDIWALGCLYLEMITWLMGGWNLVESFQRRRDTGECYSYYRHSADAAFFRIESISKDGIKVVKVKLEVTEFINHLRSLSTCTEYLDSFLEFIQTEMLIVKPENEEERGRVRATGLVSKLSSMWRKCQSSEYATFPKPQRRAKRSMEYEESTRLVHKQRRV